MVFSKVLNVFLYIFKAFVTILVLFLELLIPIKMKTIFIIEYRLYVYYISNINI